LFLKALLDGLPSIVIFKSTPPKLILSGRICSRAAILSPLLQASTIVGCSPEKSVLHAIYGSPSKRASILRITIVQGGRIFNLASVILFILLYNL